MKNTVVMIAAVLAFCCALMAGPASQARAAETCITQGALAAALADRLGIQVTTHQAAADALTLRGIKPKLGWDVEACLTNEVRDEVKKAFGDAAEFEKAMKIVGHDYNRKYPPVVSPATPQ